MLPAVLLVAAGSMWLAGWRPGEHDPSVVVSDGVRINENVENGTAFDRAGIDLGTARKVVLPDTAAVRRSAEAGAVELLMAKRLAFGGHPPARVSIRDARRNMGCAVKAEGDALVVATYGEWDSHIEGGADMRLVAVVPEGVEVEQRKGLSGEASAGREWRGEYLTRPKDAKGGWWYGPASPAGEWSAVPAVPDPGVAARADPAGGADHLRPWWYAAWLALGASVLVTWAGVANRASRRWRVTMAAVGCAGGAVAFLTGLALAWEVREVSTGRPMPWPPGGVVWLLADLAGLLLALRRVPGPSATRVPTA